MAVYYVWSGAAGSGNGSSWANAAITLTAGFVLEAAGDTLYVAHDHAESTASAVSLTSGGGNTNPSKVVCVDRAGSVPPVSADRRATATVTTTGASNITMNGVTHYDGIIFSAGTSSNAASILIATTNNHAVRFDNCSLRLAGSSSSSAITVGGSTVTGYAELNNTTMSFSGNQTVSAYGRLKWRNTASALLGTMPTSGLITAISARGSSIECIGVDLSAMGSGKTLVAAGAGSTGGSVTFIDCKLNAAVTKAATPASYSSTDVDFVRSGASGNYAVARYRISGTLTEETTIVRTGGATDGTTPISWKVVTSAASTISYSLPFECPPIAIWNDTTGSAKIATIECISSAVMKDDECWVELEYLGDASSPQGSFVSDSKSDLLATGVNQTTSAETWGGSTAAFKLSVTFTAQQKGWVYCRVKVAKANSTVYIDPLITLT